MQTNLYGTSKLASEEDDNMPKDRPASPISIPNDCVPSDEAFAAVINDLVSDVIIDFCFQVHPAAKVGIFKADDDDLAANETEDIFGQKKGKLKVSKVDCPYCPRKIEATRFANHLEKCNNGNGRSARNASRKSNVETINDSDYDDEEDDENENDVSYGFSSRKRQKKKSLKTSVRKKANTGMNAEGSGNIQQQLGMDSFLKSYCGVKSKHTKKLCNNSLKCSQHSHEQRLEIRNQLLPNSSMNQSQPKVEDDIEVDICDEDPSSVYINQTFSENSTPDYSE